MTIHQALAAWGSRAVVGLLAMMMPLVWAADIADTPLGTMTDGTAVRANVMFILDDSGSMSWDYLPDSTSSNTSKVCHGVADINKIFYDPSKTYLPPLQPNGAPYPNASFNAAKDDGFNAASATRNLGVLGNLTTPEIDHDANSATAKTKFYWATLKPGEKHDCNKPTKYNVKLGGLTAAEQTNYANWFSYYRTRMLAMRSGAGRAFAGIDGSRFRVGFSTISYTGVADGAKFLNIRNYDEGSQKADFFTRLYGSAPSGWTPLRPALEKAGRYYANKASGQTIDPVQYSCQRNYTILSTDGYWNTNGEPSGYSPKRLDGSPVGNPDGGTAVPRPQRDSCAPNTTGPTYCSGVSGSGFGNSLADIAMYFYETDLRTPTLGNCSGGIPHEDVCANNVFGDGKKDTAEHQHMTTFTLGLGVDGVLKFNKNYETQTSGDFWDIRQGTKVWPNPMQAEGPTRIDDLWHAAVNGRGVYYSASDSKDLADSLIDALSKIDAKTGSASAAATSSLTPSSGDDWLFLPLYETKTWVGTVNAYKINTATGERLSAEPMWSAADRIKAQGARTIRFRVAAATNGLADFTHANLSAAGFSGWFSNLCGPGPEKLSQCASLSAAAKTKMTGANVVDFLRGQSTYEMTAASEDDRLFRERKSPLGDIVNGAPVYVKRPPFKYADPGYDAFVSAQSGRQAMLYVAANDGMLHALKVSDDATGGTELWAYVPSMVIPEMYRLADKDYESKHRFFVDGAPVVADVYDGSKWRTILVGGLGKGGRGYYALDITDPVNPKSLWEFTDADLGYTFGNPIVTKNKAGKWIVVFTSGYNNTSGKGFLYVVDAVTGAQLKKIGTSTGTPSEPSNLGKINGWVDDDTNNVAKVIYGADMLGNVWRFDFDDNFPGDDAFLVARTGASQPITTKPVLSEVAVGAKKYVLVSVATGRYLGVSDVADGSLQAVYTFKDDWSSSDPLGLLSTNLSMVKQKLKADRSGLDSPAPVDWATKAGWFVNLELTSGERVNVDFDQQLNMLIVASNIPTPTACTPGGTSWLYYFDVGSGKLLQNAYPSDTLVAGITTIVSSAGKLITLVQGVDGKNTPRLAPELNPGGVQPMRRMMWRELAD